MNAYTGLRRRLAVLLAVLVFLLVSNAPASAQVVVTGAIDTQSGLGVLTGTRGFSLTHRFTLNDNFVDLGLNGCNGDPLGCAPGASLDLQAVEGDLSWSATLDGASYAGGCASCTVGLTFEIDGSIVLPPIAPTAIATSRFTMTGIFFAPGEAVSFGGSGTATVFLRSPGTPGFPNSWRVERAVLRFDSALPAPWTAVDIGKVGVEGATSGSLALDGSSSFSVAGAGGDIWGTTDAFQFAFAYPSGHEIVARVDGEQSTNPFAKAGVMLRSSLDADAAHVLLDVKPDGGIELLSRSERGGETAYLGGVTVAFPVWLKLTQNGGTTASISTDGQTWQTIGSVALVNGVFGLAVTSHNPAMLNEAAFSHVRIVSDSNVPPPSGWLQSDIGSVGMQGSATFDGMQATISGEGADIWGHADAFHFVYHGAAGDGEMIARVTSLANTSPFAKAGLMLRQSTAATSPHVLLDVKPDGGIEFMARTVDGGSTQFIGGAFQTMPAWLKLERRGSTVTGWVSGDGASWTPVGRVDVAGLSGGFVGLAVTSHAPGLLTTATFDSMALNALQTR